MQLDIQLVDTASGIELYNTRIERPRTTLFSVQQDIVEQVIVALVVHLNDVEREAMLATGTKNVEAFLAIKSANHILDSSEQGRFLLAVELSRRAITLEPDFEGAYRCLLIAFENIASFVSAEENKSISKEVEILLLDIKERFPNSEVHSMARFVHASLRNEQMRMITPIIQVLKAHPYDAGYENAGAPPYLVIANALLNAGLVDTGNEYRQSYMNVSSMPLENSIFFLLKHEGIESVVTRRKEVIAQNPDDILMLFGMVMDLARTGKIDRAREYLGHLEQADEEGRWVHHARQQLMVREKQLVKESAEYRLFQVHPNTVNLSRGHFAFMMGDVLEGIEHWRDLTTMEQFVLHSNLPFFELDYPNSMKTDLAYLELKNELGMGSEWRSYLIAKVRELEPFTGISNLDS
jgi:hypothetical protein